MLDYQIFLLFKCKSAYIAEAEKNKHLFMLYNTGMFY